MADGLAPVVILGAGGHAKVLVEALHDRRVVGHLSRSDGEESAVSALGPRLGSDVAVAELAASGHAFAIGIGFVDRPGADRRAELLDQLGDAELVTVVHPSAVVSPSAEVGAGTFVGPGAIIGAGARLGRAVIVNSGAVVDHDGVVGDNVHIGPGTSLSGGVRVGAGTLVGVGSTVREGIEIGAEVVVGAGAAVVRDLPARVTAVGVPASVVGPTP